MPPSRLAAVSFAALCAAGPLGARTAEPPAAQTAVELLPIFIFSAARDYRDILDTPAPATVLDAVDIADRAPSTYEDLLGDIPGVNIGGGPRAISQEPNIRGFDDDQVLIRVDGARQNFNAGHRGRFFTDPQALKRVEVVRGGASTLFGSGAMGGVIALETKDAADYLAPGETFGGRAGAGWSSQGNEFLAHGAAAADFGMFDATGFLSWRPMSEDLTDGDGDDILNSQIDTQSAILKLGFEPNAAHRFEASWQACRDEGDTPPNANDASTPATVVGRELDHQTARLGWEFAPADSDLWDPTALAWASRTELTEDRYSDGRSDYTELTTLGLDVANVSRLDLGLPVALAYGVEVYQDDLAARRHGGPRLQSPDATLTFASVFASADVELSRGVTLTPGLRFDHWEVKPDGTFADRSEGQLSPPRRKLAPDPRRPALRLRLPVLPRAPGVRALRLRGPLLGPRRPHRAGPQPLLHRQQRLVPNPDLKPEKALQFEVGGRWSRDDVARRGDRVTLSASAYYADVPTGSTRRAAPSSSPPPWPSEASAMPPVAPL